MRCHRLATVVISVALAVGIGAGPSQALSGCSGDAASAVDQYCEPIPTPNNGPTPLGPVGTPGGLRPLASTLPHRTVQRILRAPKRAVLLTIPAPYRHKPAVASRSANGPGTPVGTTRPTVSSWPLIRVPVLVIAGLALLHAGIVLSRRRSPHGTGAVPPGSQ
jgi:hypothetical protein